MFKVLGVITGIGGAFLVLAGETVTELRSGGLLLIIGVCAYALGVDKCRYG